MLKSKMLLYLALLAASAGVCGGEPNDPDAIPEVHELLDWLNALPGKTDNRVVVGQQIKQKYDDDYQKCVVDLKEETGKWVGFFHTQSSENWVRDRFPHAWDVTYPRCYNMAKKGAVLMILYNPRNPFDASGIQHAASSDVNISDLWTAGNLHYDVLHEDMDILASGLKRLEADGIPVIIRLFGEHSRSHFWFHQGHSYMNTEEFRTLWTHIVDYITNEKDVHNVLWCSEIKSRKVSATGESALNAYVDDKIDINGIQFGTGGSFGTLPLYTAYKALNDKPIIVPQALFKGNTDLKEFINNIRDHNPDISMFSAWGTLEDGKNRMQLIYNDNYRELFEDPWIMTADETPFRFDSPEKHIPTSIADGVLEGEYAWNFNTEKDFEGWKNEVQSIHQMRVEHNQLYVFYFGHDPIIAGPDDMNMQSSDQSHFTIRMMNHSMSTTAVLQWITTTDEEWNDEKSIPFDINRNGLDYSTYSVNLSEHSAWAGEIKRVRIRLAPNSCWDSAEIDYLGFTSEAVSSRIDDGVGNSGGKKPFDVRKYNAQGRKNTASKSQAPEVSVDGVSIPLNR